MVSDVHGNVEALEKAADGADALVCLGDLVLFLDYADHTRGIFADLFGAAAAGNLIELRTAGRFDEARAFSAELWGHYGDSRGQVLAQAIREQYRSLFEAMPTPAFLTYGNVDVPDMWPEFLRAGMTVIDGGSVEIEGRRFGFVGGGLRTPMRTPFEVDDDTFAAKVSQIGQVDVLCAHIPPAVATLLYDVGGRRLERGSGALLEFVRAYQPSFALFGHVHNPLASRCRVGRTECLNVGHFRASGRPFALQW